METLVRESIYQREEYSLPDITMSGLEDTLAQGVKDQKIPHAVVFATNADGTFTSSFSSDLSD